MILYVIALYRCESGKTIKIIPSDSFVMVLPPQKPTIEINGTSNLPRDYEDFRLGVRVFSDVRITISSDRDDNEEWRNGELTTEILWRFEFVMSKTLDIIKFILFWASNNAWKLDNLMSIVKRGKWVDTKKICAKVCCLLLLTICRFEEKTHWKIRHFIY